MPNEIKLNLPLYRPRLSQGHVLSKFVSTTVNDVTYQVSRKLAQWFWRKLFLSFRAWQPAWSCDYEHLTIITFFHPMLALSQIYFLKSCWFCVCVCFKWT